MARKLGLGWGLACIAATFLAGCQSTSGSRLANNSNHKSPAIARQGKLPQPNFPTGAPSNNSGFSAANGYPTSPNVAPLGNNAALPSNPNITPISNQTNNPPLGPQGLGTPTTTSNRSNVTITQPVLPPQAPAAPVGFQQIAPPPAMPELPQLP